MLKATRENDEPMGELSKVVAHFRDFDSAERGTLCHLYEYDHGWGAWLGSVWNQDFGGWVWETDECDWDEEGEDAGHGTENTRREAKCLKRSGLL